MHLGFITKVISRLLEPQNHQYKNSIQKLIMDKRTLVYATNYLTNVLINFDHGIIPACTSEMKKDLAIDDVQLGMLGSAVYAGLVIGSAVGSAIFSRLPTKTIVVTSITGCVLSLSMFIITRNYYLLLVSRFFVGFFQIFLVVFFPVWIDFYAQQHKTLWLTFMQLGVALGAVLGYLVTALLIQAINNWYFPYYIQIGLLVPCLLAYGLFFGQADLDTKGVSDSLKETQSEQNDLVGSSLRTLLENTQFLFSMLALSALFFVVTGIQFWITDYMREIMGLPQAFVFKAFLVISLTAPIFGVLCGGILLHNFGGYDGPFALRIVLVEALLASIAASPIAYLDSWLPVFVLLWLLLFFGASAVPAITGIMIASIPTALRSSGNSLSHLFQELLGYLPAPMLYGFVQSYGGPKSRYGMIMLTSWSYLGLLFVGLTLIGRKESPPEEGETELLNLCVVETPPAPTKLDFTYIKRQTSLSDARSSYKRVQSIESPLYRNIERGSRPRKQSRQKSFNEMMVNLANFVGRGSIDGTMVKEFCPQVHIPPHKVYLISEGRYLEDEPKRKKSDG